MLFMNVISGLLGEMLSDYSKTIVIKKHEYPMKMGPEQNVILIIRNPFDAYIAEFNRQSGGHVGHANEKVFSSSSKFQEHLIYQRA